MSSLSLQEIQAEIRKTKQELKSAAKKPPKKKPKVQDQDNDTDNEDAAKELRDEKRKKKESIQHHEWDEDESQAQEDRAVDRAVKSVLSTYLPPHVLESVAQSVSIEPFPEIPPELLKEITTAHSTLSREAFISDFECSFIETKDYQLQVDLSDMLKGMDMEVDDLEPVGPFATVPLTVSETCIDFSTGVQAVQRDHTDCVHRGDRRSHSGRLQLPRHCCTAREHWCGGSRKVQGRASHRHPACQLCWQGPVHMEDTRLHSSPALHQSKETGCRDE